MLATLLATALLTSANPVLIGYGYHAKVSSDGEHVAYVLEGARRIGVMTINGSKVGSSTDIPELTPAPSTSQERRIIIQGVEWAANGKKLFVIHSEQDLQKSQQGGNYWFLQKSFLSSWDLSLESSALITGRKELDASTEEIHQTIRRDALGGALIGVTRTSYSEPESVLDDEKLNAWVESFEFRAIIHNLGQNKTDRLTKTSDLNDAKLLPFERGLFMAKMRKVELKTQNNDPYEDDGYSKYVDASANGDLLVYEQQGNIVLYRRSTKSKTIVDLKSICHSVRSLSISNDGSTVVFTGYEIKNGEDTYKSAIFKFSVEG